MLCSQFLDVNSSSWNTALMLWLLFLQGKRHAQKVRLYFLNKELEEMAYKKRADQKAERIHSRVRFPLSPVFPYFEFYLVFQWRVVASSFMGILISEKLVFVWHLWGCKGGGGRSTVWHAMQLQSYLATLVLLCWCCWEWYMWLSSQGAVCSKNFHLWKAGES